MWPNIKILYLTLSYVRVVEGFCDIADNETTFLLFLLHKHDCDGEWTKKEPGQKWKQMEKN